MARVLISIGVIQLFIMLVSLARSKALSLLLGPAGLGVVSVLDQTVVTVVTLAALSLPFTAMKFMARSHSEGKAAFQRSFATFLRALVGLALAAVILVAAILTWKPGVFGQELARYRSFLSIAVLGVPAAMLHIFFVNTLAAAQKPAQSARLSFLVSFVLAGAGVTGALLSGIGGLYVGTFSGGLLASVATCWYLRTRLGLRFTVRSESLVSELRRNPEIVSYSVYIYIALSAYYVTLLATRYFVFSRLGAVPAGLLQALLSIALTVGAVVAPMTNLYLAPLVNRRMPVADKVAAASNFAGTVTLLLLLGALPMVLFPRLALATLFSSKFVPAAPLLFTFILWQCLFQIVYVFLQLLIGLDDVLAYSVITCATYAVSALLFPVLIPRLGLVGAGVALTAGMAVAGAAATLRLRFKFACGISLGLWLRAAATLGVIALTGAVFPELPEQTVAGVLLRLGYALLVTALMWLGLRREERALLWTELNRLRGSWRARWT